jgi:predicted secreted protein
LAKAAVATIRLNANRELVKITSTDAAGARAPSGGGQEGSQIREGSQIVDAIDER